MGTQRTDKINWILRKDRLPDTRCRMQSASSGYGAGLVFVGWEHWHLYKTRYCNFQFCLSSNHLGLKKNQTCTTLVVSDACLDTFLELM